MNSFAKAGYPPRGDRPPRLIIPVYHGHFFTTHVFQGQDSIPVVFTGKPIEKSFEDMRFVICAPHLETIGMAAKKILEATCAARINPERIRFWRLLAVFKEIAGTRVDLLIYFSNRVCLGKERQPTQHYLD